MGSGNPVDLGAAASPQSLAHALQVIVDSGEVDAVLVCYAATRAGRVDDIYAAIAQAAAQAEVPIVVNCLGATHAAPRDRAGGRPPACRCSRSRRAPFARWRTPSGTPSGGRGRKASYRSWPGSTPTARGAVVRRFLEQQPGRWLAGSEAGRPAPAVCRDPGDPGRSPRRVGPRRSLAAAESVGYPVALKTAAPGVVHKTDIGGVRVGLAERGAGRRRRYDEIAAAAGDPHVVVQAMAPSGTELVIGVVRDRAVRPAR